MLKDLETLFSRLKAPEPPAYLERRIIEHIRVEKRRVAVRRQSALFAAGLVTSLAILIPAVNSIRLSLQASGFVRYVSLLFTDAGAVMASWQDYSMALLESLPVASLAACAGAILLFLCSLMLMSKFSEPSRRLPAGSLIR